ncbi:MAG: type II toxin-antitoxin system Phd/YefM family antitoxin [Xanthomonadales bacterium]|nr:type II toxin-antitoxin system Phd/YefM family antitoxin [Xanthomonadales bacterium]MCC6559819.1 type II toxin-antitoxin system Phd/YefM family antitoxin [Xanthomonadales bacterium]
MELSLTELRQRLFELADRVLETGEAIIITRRGRKLRIVRDDEASTPYSRLAKLRLQELEIGPPLDPHESPARWSELDRVAEPPVEYAIGRKSGTGRSGKRVAAKPRPRSGKAPR